MAALTAQSYDQLRINCWKSGSVLNLGRPLKPDGMDVAGLLCARRDLIQYVWRSMTSRQNRRCPILDSSGDSEGSRASRIGKLAGVWVTTHALIHNFGSGQDLEFEIPVPGVEQIPAGRK